MKIAPKSVNDFIASPQRESKAVLVYGVDNGLIRERSEKIIKAVLGKDAGDSFAKLELSQSEILEDPARLADELSAVSMMCPKRVIIIHDCTDKLTKIIESSASYFHNDNYLLLMADELPSRSSLRAFFEKQADCGALACYRDEMRDIQSVIRQKFSEAGIMSENGVIDYLVSQLGNDRYVTYQELEKLILYAGEEKKLSIEDARQLVDYNNDTQIDGIINAVADRNLQSLEKNLTQHLREGTQPIMYLRSLQRYFNKLYSLRSQMQQTGETAEMVVSSMRPPVFFKQKPILVRHLNNWNIDAIIKALRLLIAAELACKTSDIPTVAASSRELLRATQVR